MAPMFLLPQPPPMGHAIPDTHHAVSVQMTTWKDMQGLMLGDPRVKKMQKIGYPRSFLHQDIVKVNHACLSLNAKPNTSCLLFPSKKHALSCEAYITRIARQDNGHSPNVAISAIDFDAEESFINGSDIRLFAIFFPDNHVKNAMGFWRLTGTGISSRLAESLHKQLTSARRAPTEFLKLIDDESNVQRDETFPTDLKATNRICERISYLLKRASLKPTISNQVSASDVFLYPTGMSAIYHCNLLLQEWLPSESVIFGFPYELTMNMLQTYGKSCRFYGFGTTAELDDLELYLKSGASKGRRVQSIWCECASNPLLRTVDLNRIRKLADRYGIQVIVDDTIGSFANVDVLGVADIVITSLTKSFNGNGDAMGGSIVSNPVSPFYDTMKAKLNRTYRNELYGADAIILEYNSRNFLPRAAKMNQTAQYLVSLLENYATYSSSTLTHVYYPSTCWSLENYHDRMRLGTPDFTPGYGGLFTLEFENEEAASMFFNNLELHKGPSLGVCVTLAQPYVQTVFARDKEWAASYGLSETIVRISVGLEDRVSLAKAFRRALRFADQTKMVDWKVEDLETCF